jgi:hypothetical protein
LITRIDKEQNSGEIAKVGYINWSIILTCCFNNQGSNSNPQPYMKLSWKRILIELKLLGAGDRFPGNSFFVALVENGHPGVNSSGLCILN